MRFSTTELAGHLGGELVGPDVKVDGASIDSRTVLRGQLYVPIVADRDGHAFIAAALGSGASAYLTMHPAVGGTAIEVADTSVALMNLGMLARGRVGGVVGITGSVGKTTTKDMLRGCLARTFRTAASERSFNNELGLPLTLLNAPDDAQWVVLEMGARGVGHVERLARVARPGVGIVTSVAMAHVEYFGDLDGELRPRFRLSTPWGSGEVRLALHGEQQVPNALAAAGAALWCGVPLDDVTAALEAVTGSPLRMEVHHAPGGPVLVVDCYNANPASTEAALRSLAALGAGRKLALLGLMAELGAETEAEHRRVVQQAEALGIEVVGYQTDLYGPAQVGEVADAVALLRTLGPGDALLVKGSRVARLEDVARAYGSAEGVQSLVAGA